jgi:hypothetical protein
MLELVTRIGSGNERDVYLHPHQPDQVIKITRKDAVSDRNAIEYAFHRATRRLAFPGIPKMYGWSETSLGRGLAYELVADSSGVPCCSVREALKAGILKPAEARELLARFFDDAWKVGLITYDNHPGNFLYQPRSNRVVMVDGFGPEFWSSRIWFRARFRFFAKKKIRQSRHAVFGEWHSWCHPA